MEKTMDYKKLFLAIPDPIFLLEEEKVYECNQAAIVLLGKEYDQIVDTYFWKYTADINKHKNISRDKLLKCMKWTLENGKYQTEWEFQTEGGKKIPCEVIFSLVIIDDKQFVCATAREINERFAYEKKLEFFNYHDQLTGLYNHRYYENTIKDIDTANNMPLAITIANINGTKLVNDSFGHQTGNLYIKQFAEILRIIYGEKHIVCRCLGDEFIILSPHTTMEEAEKKVTFVKYMIKNNKIDNVEISASFGIAVKNNQLENYKEIFLKAEFNMNNRKQLESSKVKQKAIDDITELFFRTYQWQEAHAKRVKRYCEEMGKVLGLDTEQVLILGKLGLYHDIGLIMMPSKMIAKTEHLSEEEINFFRLHAEYGHRIMSAMHDVPEIAETILAHHERWDGKGYPKGLKNEEIPLYARILSIAESYDAMVSDRSYHKGILKEKAIEELRNGKGLQFSPELVEIFISRVLSQ